MKNFNFNSVERAAMATWRTALSGEAATKWFAALLTLTLAFGSSGCSGSKANNQAAIPGTSVQATSSNSGDVQARTVVPIQPEASVKPLEVAKKKSVKGPVHKLPATLSYTDWPTGISLKYPSRSTLKVGEKAVQDQAALERLPMNFAQSGGSTVLVVEIPDNPKKGVTPGSLFAINVNKQLSAEQCQLFSTEQKAEDESDDSQEKPAFLAATSMLTLSGVEYSEFDGDGSTRYYHRFVSGATPEQSACYEFALAASTGDEKQNGDKASANTDVQQKNGFAKLEKILASVEIKSEKKGEIETAKVTPNTADSPR